MSGRPVADATDRLQAEQLQVDERKIFSENVAAGRVVRTDPTAGERVECESRVTMLVSKGEQLEPVPDVLGLSRSSAESQLRNAGFVPNVERENSDEPEDTVIAQDPGPGGAVPTGTIVSITVSTGAGSIVVPNVEGQPRDTAISTLQGRGVTNIKVVEQETDDETLDDRVTDQAPSAGTRIRQGDRVTIFVAVFVEPPPEEPPPDFEPPPRLPGLRP